MQEPPYLRPETLDFDSEYIKVLCLASTDTVKGLQWALDRNSISDRKYKLFLGSLSNLVEHVDTDLVLLSVDISQPVPIENLKRLKQKPGLALFVQPTPQQLLQLNELPYWQSLAWDGSAFDKLALRLDEVVARFESDIQNARFLEACRNFVKRSDESIDSIEWINPPENFRGMTQYVLDPLRGTLTVGGSQSTCDLRLNLDGNNSVEVGEFRFINGKWSFKPMLEGTPIQIRGNRDSLTPGDHIEIERNVLNLKRPARIEEFIRMARRMGVVDERDAIKIREIPGQIKTVADVCRDLILSGITGELRLSSGLKSGSIYFHDGVIIYSVAGSVDGLKAFLRMLAWENPQWRLNLGKEPKIERSVDRISLREFVRIYDSWKAAWAKVSALVPPPQLKLRVVPQKFLERKEFSIKETKVLAAVAEYPLIRDVMNSCAGLVDVEIVQALVNLRRQGLIEPHKA